MRAMKEGRKSWRGVGECRTKTERNQESQKRKKEQRVERKKETKNVRKEKRQKEGPERKKYNKAIRTIFLFLVV